MISIKHKKNFLAFLALLGCFFINNSVGDARQVEVVDNYDLDVLRAQEILQEKGFYKGIIDGSMNKPFRRALKIYQKDNTLPESGDLDNFTRKQLGLKVLPIKKEKKITPITISCFSGGEIFKETLNLFNPHLKHEGGTTLIYSDSKFIGSYPSNCKIEIGAQ